MSESRITQGAQFVFETTTALLPNGRRVELDLVRHPGAAAVVPFLGPGCVLLIRQYRHAAGRELIEVPAGKLEPGESPELCAHRELEEETGYRAGRIEKLTSIWTSPGFTDEVIHLFAAFDLEATQQALEPNEIIELVPYSLEDALAAVRSGEISDAKSALSLLLAAERARGQR